MSAGPQTRLDCGCVAELIPGADLVDMSMCPLHEAAPELLAALRDLRNSVMRMAKRLDSEPGNQTVVSLWMHKITSADAVIAKAVGK